jgi:hypothetical protein
MSLENFYKKTDQETYRYRKSVISTFLLAAVVFIAIYGLYEIYDEYFSDKAKQKERINRVVALCSNLPQPEQFKFISKEILSTEKDTSTVIFNYQTERDFNEIMPAFVVWFDKHDWKPDADNKLTFRSGNQAVSIGSKDNYFSNFEIYCSEEEISFGIYD